MSQQHAQFEEEFRDGPRPQPHVSYQDNYSEPQPVMYSTPVPPPQMYVNMAGQKLLVPVQPIQQSSNNTGARLALAIVSIFFVFIMFMIAVAMSGMMYSPVAPTAIAFALLFAIVVVIINVVFNRRR